MDNKENVEINLIPDHVGLPGNIIADRLAQEARLLTDRIKVPANFRRLSCELRQICIQRGLRKLPRKTRNTAQGRAP